MEVFRDEGAPELTETVCEAITHLQYYSGEFDIEWGNSITYKTSPWHTREIDEFNNWLTVNNFDPTDPALSSGYLKIGQVDLINSFYNDDAQQIWSRMGEFLDIYRIECGDSFATYDYHWGDADHEQLQLKSLK